MLLKSQWSCLAFFVQGDFVLFNLNCCLICRLYFKPVSSPVIIFERNSGSLSSFLCRFWHMSAWFFCSWQQVVQFAAMWHRLNYSFIEWVMSKSVHIIFENALNLSKWNYHHATKFTYSDSVFKDKFLTCSTLTYHFACQWISKTFGIFIWGCTILELGKSFRNLHSPHFLLSKSYCRTFCSISSSVSSKIYCRHIALSSLPLSRYM